MVVLNQHFKTGLKGFYSKIEIILMIIIKIKMATIWVHLVDKDFYTYFSSFEEAFFSSKKLCKESSSFLSIIEYLNNHATATIGSSHNFQIIIYHGKGKPPVTEKWYPNGISFLEKDKLFDLVEF